MAGILLGCSSAIFSVSAQDTNPPPLLEVKPTGPGNKPVETVKLAKIDFIGLSHYTADAALSVSGLAAGATLSLDDIEAGAQKLSDSGWFKKLGYRLKGPASALVLTFTVEEETAVNIPVVFDNFAWFADDELQDIIRKNGVLGFDGTVPESGRAPEIIAQTLQELLAKNRLPGRVVYETLAGAGGENARILYSVKDISLRVCGLAFPGALVLTENELTRAAYELVGQDYSRYAAQVFAQYKLRPLYRQRGYWRAKFALPTAQLVKDDKTCANGVRLATPVTEGAQYRWNTTTWVNATAYDAPALDAAWGLPTGEVADETKLDKGLRALNELYQRKGYLDLGVRSEPLFDDAAQRLGWRLTLEEGPQFKMGRLTINGLPPAETQDLQKLWQLKEGDIFDAGYAQSFVTGPVSTRIAQLGPAAQGLKIQLKQTPDKKNLTVEVVISVVKAVARL